MAGAGPLRGQAPEVPVMESVLPNDQPWISPEAQVLPFASLRPVLGAAAFLAPGVRVIGDVHLGERSSLWYNTVVRGDVHRVRIGRETNLQDLCVVHVTAETHAVHIGHRVTIGHAAIIHGATIEDGCLIGMGARVLDGAVVRTGAFVAAGALVPPGMEVPPGVLAVGAPAKVRRPLTPDEVAQVHHSADLYIGYARDHARSLGLVSG